MHLRHFLGSFDRYIIAPENLTLDFDDFRILRFRNRFFSGTDGYNRLMLSTDFYGGFIDYKYILIYQLDCLVFSSQLEYWCNKEWDYLGAPWFTECSGDPVGGFWAVGNGGLSLRKVESCLAVLRSRVFIQHPKLRGKMTGRFQLSPRLHAAFRLLKTFLSKQGYKNDVRWFTETLSRLLKTFLSKHGYKNSVRWFTETFGANEDRFWSLKAKHFLPEFRVPTPREALPFSFECAPRFCFKENSECLPFGCHAWSKWDRQFWAPFLLRESNNLIRLEELKKSGTYQC